MTLHYTSTGHALVPFPALLGNRMAIEPGICILAYMKSALGETYTAVTPESARIAGLVVASLK